MPRVNLPDVALEVRKNIIKMLAFAGSGHTAGAMGSADLFTYLYFGGEVKVRRDDPTWEDRDRVVLSCGHYAPVLYSCLGMAGFFPLEELSTLRKLGSRLQGHVVRHIEYNGGRKLAHDQLPGVENTGGPLGQGVSIAVGMAIAARMKKQKHRVICVGSDGEMDEGQTWEAYMSAAKYKLGNLIFIIDRNEIQISGNVSDVMPIESVGKKLEAFGLKVKEIDGHNFEEIGSIFPWARMYPDQPKAVIMNTTPGKGVSFMEKNYLWHGIPPNKDQAIEALMELTGGGQNEVLG